MMDNAVLPSTFLLTLLLAVGLFFFIRASTKDRTQTVYLVSEQDEAALMPQLEAYFRLRAYRIAAVDQQQNQVTFEGFVRPSWFLAVFLFMLAATGLSCLALVLSLLFPNLSQWSPAILLLSPLSGLFYWQKAGRVEKVYLKVDPSKITVTAHRDELTELQRNLRLKPI